MTDYETEDLYMTAPEAKSIKGFIEALNIFAKYFDKGMNKTFFCGAEHDELHFYMDTDTLPEDSADGRRLQELGFHCGDNMWEYFT
jgi:hypothetical protein